MASTESSRDHDSVETPRQDPFWPDVDHPVTELMAPTQGASSPFGETEFPLPLDSLGYEHPSTQINR
jgi:hypothetical protein